MMWIVDYTVQLFRSPAGFFTEKRAKGLKSMLLFFGVITLTSLLLESVIFFSDAFYAAVQSEFSQVDSYALASVITLPFRFIYSFFMLGISSLLTYGVVWLFGRRGFTKVLSVLAYSTVIILPYRIFIDILTKIKHPYIAAAEANYFVVILWVLLTCAAIIHTLVVEVVGTKKLFRLSTARSLVVILLPLIVMAALTYLARTFF